MLKTLEYTAVIVAIVFAVCLAALMFFYSSPAPSTEEPQQQHAEKYEAKQHEANLSKPFWQTVSTDPISLFTLFFVIFTAVLSGVGVIQLKMLVRAETVAEKSADAAKRSAKTGEESLLKLQRAFVGVQQINYLSHLNTTTQTVWWTFHVQWRNSGTSPTKNLRLFVARYLENVDIPDTFEFTLPETPGPTTFLVPNAITQSGEMVVTGDDLAAVQEGKKFLYLWGRADYRDVFDNTPTHVTKFFFRVGLRGDPTKEWNQTTNVVEMLFENQSRHNCADEECDKE